MVDPNLLKQYLNQVYLRDDTHTFAFKGEKRYREITQPKSTMPIGDPWIIPELPPDAPKAVVEDNKVLREQMESIKKMVKSAPHAVSFSKDPLGLPPFERWGCTGVELRHLGSDGGEIFTVGTDKFYKHPFNSEYLGSVGMAAIDPVLEADPQELQDLNASINLCRLLQSAGPAVRVGSVTGGDQPRVYLERSFEGGGLNLRERFEFDPNHGLTPVSRSLQDAKTNLVMRSWVFSDPTEVIKGLWLPKKVIMTLHAPPWGPVEYGGKPFLETHMTLLKTLINEEVPDSLFEVKFDPGMKVANFPEGRKLGLRGGSPLFYNMPADSRQLDEVIAEAAHIASRDGQLRWGSRRWLIAGNLVLLIAVIGFSLYR